MGALAPEQLWLGAGPFDDTINYQAYHNTDAYQQLGQIRAVHMHVSRGHSKLIVKVAGLTYLNIPFPVWVNC